MPLTEFRLIKTGFCLGANLLAEQPFHIYASITVTVTDPKISHRLRISEHAKALLWSAWKMQDMVLTTGKSYKASKNLSPSFDS